MGESDITEQGIPLEEGQPSDGVDTTTSTPQPKMYSEEEVNAAIEKASSDALARAGRERKAIEEERDQYKARISSFDENLAELQEDRAKLKAMLEDLGAKDPDKGKIVQKIKDLDAESKALKADRARLEAEKAQHAEMVKVATERTRAYTIKDVAALYENGDAAKLKAICDKAKILGADEINSIAEELGWKKKGITQKTHVAAPKSDSGNHSGGDNNIDKMTPFEKIAYGLAHPNK